MGGSVGQHPCVSRCDAISHTRHIPVIDTEKETSSPEASQSCSGSERRPALVCFLSVVGMDVAQIHRHPCSHMR